MFRGFMLLSFVSCLAAGFASGQAPQPSVSNSAAGSADRPATLQKAASGNEDWSRMPVDRKVLRPFLTGLVMSRTETANYTSELVRLQWRPADPIDIWVIKPHGVQKPRVALYLYSYPSNIDRFREDSWCMAATRNGLAAVGFVSALTGDRFRGRPMREWFVPELQESIGSSVHDVQLIIDYLGRRGDLSVDKVGMFGQGSGGTIAILSAASDPRIRAVDALNPWGDWSDWLKSSPVLPDSLRASLLTPAFLKSASAVEPVAYLPALKDRALRVQQIMDYPNTPAEARDKIAAAVPADELIRFKDRTAHAEAWKTFGLSGWLANQLNPQSGGDAARASK
jgi:hypothetical protein